MIDYELRLLVNNWLRIPYKFPCTSLIIRCVTSDVFYPRLTRIQFPCTSRYMCSCCKCQLLFSVTFDTGRGLRVFRTVFDLRFERLLCRCNLLTQECVRWLHVTSFAEMAILDLALGIRLPNKRHPDYVSNCCDIALFEELCNHHRAFFFIGILPERIEWCEEDSLSSWCAFLSTWNVSVLQDRLDAERTTPRKYIFLPIVRN